MQAQYNHWIVALSYVVAVLASYVALDMASRVSASRGSVTARYWMLAGPVAMGAGIWSMHFVGMLAFHLPIEIPYSVPVTILSLLFAIGASGVALYTINHETLSRRRLLTAGVIMGGGIGLMHYIGMAAMEVVPIQTYDPILLAVSIAIAIAASISAMWLCFQLKSGTSVNVVWKKCGSALVMGFAIWGMHFTGMAAAQFAPNTYCLPDPGAIDQKWLALTVGVCTFVFLAATTLISLVDARMTEARTSLEAQSDRVFTDSVHPICICGFDGRYQRVNPAFCQTLGYSHAAVMEMDFLGLIHDDDQAGVSETVRLAGEGRTGLQVECRCRCADGSYRSLLWSATPSTDGHSIYATAIDITDRKLAEGQLVKAHQALVEASRLAGMAEVATSVLHNVGNVLNSVNVSASLAIESVKGSKASALARVVTLLREHEADLGAFLVGDARGRQLPAFLGQLSEHLQAEQAATVKELESLCENVDHIKQIVTAQQSLAKVSGLTEQISVHDLVEDSLRMVGDALKRHGVAVVREFSPAPPVEVEKHKVVQILVNLLRNAKFACIASPSTDKRVTARIGSTGGRVQISVTDNGIGIAPENLTRIFGHGFTTRKDGHGFGLHSGALAAREIGGSLTVHSDGPGKGATFTLDLPLQASGAPA